MKNDITSDFNKAPIEKRLECILLLLEEAIHIREDAWFHYQDALPYEVKDITKYEVAISCLRQMVKNKGKICK